MMQLLAQSLWKLIRLKLNLLGFLFYFFAKWALKEFQKNLVQVPSIIARQLWFPFSKPFVYDLKKRKLIYLLSWCRIIKFRGKRISALNFAMEKISDFKLSTRLSANYYHRIDVLEQETILIWWNILAKAGQSLG